MKAAVAKEDRLFYAYRYASLALTSFVYLIRDSDPPALPYKAGIVLALFLSMKGMSVVYRRSRRSSPAFKAAVAAEVAGILLLTIPTGGMGSPFLWCILNPMLLGACYVSALYCWSLLIGFLLLVAAASTVTSVSPLSIGGVLLDNSYFYMLFLLIMLAIQVMADAKKELLRAHGRTNETMEHIKSLYHIVEAATQSKAGNMAYVFAEFSLKLTKQKTAFFWESGGGSEKGRLIVQGIRNEAAEAHLLGKIERSAAGFAKQDSASIVNLREHGEYLVVPVKTSSRFLGVLGVRIERWHMAAGRRWFVQQLYFLSELCAVIMERHQLERIEHQLTIIEEQNRIAEEMHDSVSQHLFGIVYAIHSLNRKWQDVTEEQLRNQLQLIEESSHIASKELRSTIYSLSSRKHDGAFWFRSVRAHLDNVSRLNEVDIRLEVEGDDRLLPVHSQKALHRIISEAVGNAIRHGHCSRVDVLFRLRDQEAFLVVKDDGVGFAAKACMEADVPVGLGLDNMKLLAQSMDGVFDIDSTPETGTQITVRVPDVARRERGHFEESLDANTRKAGAEA
ncbi:sensor histidine kinase [Paenibacillus cymbidii]|uniref:sensor histidine kinase n=1 Tax=Paenibacillus cymbidii TaxID=1639034 RepID=UPI001F18D49B|nr:ATP-binding protein [Paenibacillus cymbidii]